METGSNGTAAAQAVDADPTMLEEPVDGLLAFVRNIVPVEWLSTLIVIVIALAVTAGCAGVATVREVRSPAQAVVITTERNVPPETAAPMPTAAPKQPQTTAAADAAYIGNRNSMKYHRAGCRYAAQVKTENRITFDSAEQALTAGYTPCGACKP